MPRFSRISWKSREDAEPPRMPSRSEAAKRRRSERAIPGAPRQRLYCSVSLRAKRSPGGGALTSGGGARGPFCGGPALPRPPAAGGSTGRAWARVRVAPAAERVEDLRDLLRAVRARALEEQMLDEVRDAGPVDALVP